MIGAERPMPTVTLEMVVGIETFLFIKKAAIQTLVRMNNSDKEKK